eukprot:scaffold2035_cov19-Tisochrysis_lutea.AAC.1
MPSSKALCHLLNRTSIRSQQPPSFQSIEKRTCQPDLSCLCGTEPWQKGCAGPLWNGAMAERQSMAPVEQSHGREAAHRVPLASALSGYRLQRQKASSQNC